MIINTQQPKIYDYQVDYDIPIYTLFLKPYSFMVCLNKPYYNRHKHLSYPVKAISFNKPLMHNIKYLYIASLEKNNNMVLRYLFVFKGLKPFPSDYAHNLSIEERGDYFVFLNVIQFIDWIKLNEHDINNYIIIFNDFCDWSDIIRCVFVLGRIHLDGSDSSTRHMFSDLSIRLASHLSLLSSNNIRNLEGLIVKDKSILKPKLDLVNIDAYNFKQEKEGSIIYFKNVYIEFKDYAIDMMKWRNDYTSLSSGLYNKIQFTPLINYSSTHAKQDHGASPTDQETRGRARARTRAKAMASTTDMQGSSNFSKNASSTPVCSEQNIKSFDLKRKFHMSARSRGFSLIKVRCFSYTSLLPLHSIAQMGLSLDSKSTKDKTGLEISLTKYNKNSCYAQELDVITKGETIDSIFESNVFKSDDVFRLICNNVINIIENNPINTETQFKLENYLFNQYKDLAYNKEIVYISDVDFSIFNKEFKVYCFSKVNEFEFYLDGLRESLNLDKKLNKGIDSLTKSVDIHDFYIKKLLNILSNKEIINFLFYILFLVVTFNKIILEGDDLKETEKTQIGLTSISMNLGKKISNAYISKLHKGINENLEILTSKQAFKDYKEEFLSIDKQYVFNSSEFFLRLSSKLIEIMSSCGMLEIKVHTSYDSSLVILTLTNELEKLLKNRNPIAVLPFNLPMIVAPKEYSKQQLGGYLLNGVEYDENLIGLKMSYGIPSVIVDKNIIFNSLNNMMRTPFKINKDLLNYLLKYNHIHNLLISSDYIHQFANVRRTKIQEREYQKFLNHKVLEKHIILIAHIFSNVSEIYFPLRLDQRGRLYPTTAYFHYQSSELAKALILFARPDIIKRTDRYAIEYLKAYGATCFGNGLNRKAYTKRLQWVENNWNKIIEFENSDLVNKADEKYLFLSFCFEMRRFNNFLNNENIHEFKTYLPIQLDGTCNGFQHLALLSNETKIFDTLNLGESKKSKDPADFYSHIVDILGVHLEYKKINSILEKDKLEDLESKKMLNLPLTEEEYLESQKRIEQINILQDKIKSIERLLVLGINRSTIKPVIMNKPYNATDRTLVAYVRELLDYAYTEKKLELDDKGNQVYDEQGEAKVIATGWYKLDKESNNCVNYKDLELLVKSIDEIIYIKYPKIKLLTKYFHDIGIILNKLNLPIIWRLPHGLMISQKYMMQHTLKINPFAYLSNTLSLTITDKIKMDKNKQLLAFIPNLVHSLDAATLTLLYSSLAKTINSDGINSYLNFYSVHDCYGVTAKYVDLLIETLRTVYIQLYSSKGYIEKFDEDIINIIIITQGEDKCKYSPEDRIIYINKKKIVLPDLSKFLNVPNKTRVYKRLSKSIFLIK